MVPILSLPHLNTALEKQKALSFKFFFMCGLIVLVTNPEFKLRMHFSECFFYLLLFLEQWLMWSLAYRPQFPKKEAKSYAGETFPVLPFKGQIPIITNCWSDKRWMSFISGTAQSGGQRLHSL